MNRVVGFLGASFALGVVLGLSCGQESSPRVSLDAHPFAIDANGQTTALSILILETETRPAKGQVKLTAPAGTFEGSPKQITLSLDSTGRVQTTFACDSRLDPGCSGRVEVVAAWKTASGSVPITVGVGSNSPDASTPGTTSSACVARDGGTQACSPGCPNGFHCELGSCVLNGGSGPVQVTLRWNRPVDLDLHVVEPLPDGGSCEIYYGDTNRAPSVSSCGAKGSLDLDSNAACTIDNVDIENVIYPASAPAPRGEYKVRVDYWRNCSITDPVPYEVIVRYQGQVNAFFGSSCDSFNPTDEDRGGRGSGREITRFTVR